MDKKLYRNTNNKIFAGVCSGIADFFSIDPTIIRLAWALLSLLSAGVAGLVIYIVCAFVIPEMPPAGDGEYNYDPTESV